MGDGHLQTRDCMSYLSVSCNPLIAGLPFFIRLFVFPRFEALTAGTWSNVAPRARFVPSRG